jgi:allophanate hydrolase subunit 1
MLAFYRPNLKAPRANQIRQSIDAGQVCCGDKDTKITRRI